MDNPTSHAPVSFRSALPGDVRALPPVARRIFTETFESRFGGAAFDAFCETAYGPAGTMARDLADPAIAWRVAEQAGVPVGYAKLRPWTGSPGEAGAMELQQIYVLSSWHGKGVAEALMHWAVDEALARGARSLYLTVFDHNERAKRFYARHGFAEVGHCEFRLGDQVYDDRVWRRTLV
ncbi:MAG TPA: GNAT family N-acetyltransferase [Frateuria sp.]|uniref:GNAT family N-acetyltransferase n=1 Tax=Frateuria sp. TaxID=2211372 RepID=UPI002DEEEEB4|nr:GNAT family N-acetyltransferase [Frateuria sp.]